MKKTRKKGEIFKHIDGFNYLYLISNYGRVYKKEYYVDMPNGGKRKCGDKFLKADVTKNGYHQVTLCYKNFTKRFKVHRLVAEYFIENPDDLPQVNHKNGRKQQNSVDNLEWCTASQNQLHSIHVLGNYPKREGRGVHYREGFKSPWIAQVSVRGKKLHLGSFKTEEEAAERYNTFIQENDL